MYTFIPRSLCALKRICAKQEHSRFSATTAIRLTVREGLFRAEATDGRRAVVVQGSVPEDAPWPAFVHTPDDAFEALILPEDLERAFKVSKGTWAGQRDVIGVATIGPNDVCIGRGPDVVTARLVQGRFPAIDQVIPRTRPVVSFKVDPKLLANTLLALSELLPDHEQGVDLFYYGEGLPIGMCGRNSDNGMMLDALFVPLVKSAPQHDEQAAAAAAALKAQAAALEADEEEAAEEEEMLAEYSEAKNRHPDKLVLLPIADYYETFYEDAERLAEVLELEVVPSAHNEAPVAGFPKDALEEHLPKLQAAGIGVVITGPRDEEADYQALKDWIETVPEAAVEAAPEPDAPQSPPISAPAPEPEPQPEPKRKRGRKGRKAA